MLSVGLAKRLWAPTTRASVGPEALFKSNELPTRRGGPERLQILLQERFDLLRLPMVNVRGYLTAYVQAIGLSVEAVVPAYMKKVQDWQSLHNR